MNTNSRTFSKKNTIINIGDYYNRHNFYNKTKTAFSKIKTNECLNPIYTTNNRNIEYIFGNNHLILKNRIGSNSRYGIVYLTMSKESYNYKFATKLTPAIIENHNEIIIASKLSNITIKDMSPHFLIIYKTMICNNKKQLSKALPNLIKYNNYLISVNELVSGNFKNFLNDDINPSLILNALQQILISILSFHYFTGGYFHNDCHYKNFLFHKINPGGYFHYNIYGKDIYIKNMGYVWIIWDFGLVKKKNVKRRLEDYFRILYFFNKYYGDQLSIIGNVYRLKIDYFSVYQNSDRKFFQSLFEISNLFQYTIPENSKIINTKPYIIK